MNKICRLKRVVFNLFLVIVFMGGYVYAQNDTKAPTNEVEVDVDALITNPDKMPEFPGGEQAFNDFLRKNIRYPQLAKENNIMGKVFASFIVNTDGSISDIKIVRAIGGGCDEEVIRVLRLMPNWKPGEVSGRAVKVKYMVPVRFSIQ